MGEMRKAYVKNKPRSTFGAPAALLIWFCHLAIAVFFYIRGELWGYEAYYWGALFVFIASFPYLVAALKGKFILYEALYLFMGAFVVSHVACMFLNQDEIWMDLPLWTYVMKILIVGTIFFLAGYAFGLTKIVARKLPLRNFIIPNNLLFKLPAKLYFIGWALRLTPMILVRMFPYPENKFFVIVAIQYLQGWQIMTLVMTNAIYIAIMIDSYICFSNFDPAVRVLKKRKYLYRFLFFFTAEILYAFTATGMKENVLIPIILVFIIYFRAKKKIPYIALVSAVIIFVGGVMPFMQIYREQRRAGRDFEDSMLYTYDRFYTEKEYREGQIYALNRLSNPLEMGIISSELREMGIRVSTYKNMFDYLSRFIPRFLWPNKPSIDYNIIGKQMGVLSDDDYKTSISLTLIGSLVLNYGIYGVIIGMFLIGFIFRILWEWLIVRTEDNLFSFMIYFLAVYTWIRFDEFPICLHSNVSFFIYLYLMLNLVKKRQNFYVRNLRNSRY